MASVLEQFVRQNGYFEVVGADLNLQHLSHPDYSSIKSITDTLTYFEIDNLAVNVPKESLDQLPSTFLAFMNPSEKESYALVRIGQNKIHLNFEEAPSKIVSESDFKKLWSGDMVAIESSKKKPPLAFDFKLAAVLVAFAILLVLQILNFSVYGIASLGLSILGIYFSNLIAKQELGIYSYTGETFCRMIDSATSCADVIKSAKSKLFGKIPLTDLSVIYFFGSTMVCSLLGPNIEFNLLATGLSLPVISYSILQQWFVIKKWCTLCIVIVAIFCIEGILAGLLLDVNSATLSLDYTLRSILLFVVVAFSWTLIKPMIKNGELLIETRRKFLKFRRNPLLFDVMLRQRIIKNKFPGRDRLEFGSGSPKVKIDAITNPFCGFCVESAMTYDKLLAKFGSVVQINLILNVPFDQPENPSTKIACRMIDLYKELGQADCWIAIKRWFEIRDVEKWQKIYGVSNNLNKYCNTALLENRKYCQENSLHYTPITIIDNYMYPLEYQIVDLPLMLEPIIEDQEKINAEIAMNELLERTQNPSVQNVRA